MGGCLTFSQGQTAPLVAQFVTSPDGSPVNVPDAEVLVLDPNLDVALPATTMENLLTGLYAYEWDIPNSSPVGTYTIRYTGTVLGIPTAITDTMMLLPAGAVTSSTAGQSQAAAIAALERYLACAQSIPVYRELGRRITPDRTKYQMSWPRWNLGNHLIFQNNEILDGTEYTADFDAGTITFESPRHSSDKIWATYNFRFFPEDDILRFLNDALSKINIEPGGTGAFYTLDNLPDNFIGTLMEGAAAFAIRKLLMCINFQQPATIFGGREGAQDAKASFMALKENYEKQFVEDRKLLKRTRWPGTVGVIQPEFTMPGGRSRWFRYLFSGSSM